jgi:hypothetical protein
MGWLSSFLGAHEGRHNLDGAQDCDTYPDRAAPRLDFLAVGARFPHVFCVGSRQHQIPMAG